MSKIKNKVINWATKCNNSNGKSFMIPKNFVERANSFMEEADKLTEIGRASCRERV